MFLLPAGEPDRGAVALLPQLPGDLVAPSSQVLGRLPVHHHPAINRGRDAVLNLETEVSHRAQERTNSDLPAQPGPRVVVEETEIKNTRSVKFIDNN